MPNNTATEPATEKSGATKSCRFCCDDIPAKAVICKTCQEPQKEWRHLLRLGVALLTTVGTFVSLFLAVLQTQDAIRARESERAAKKSEQLVAEASAEVVKQMYDAATPTAQKAITEKLSRENITELERKVQSSPTDLTLRKNLLLRKAIAPAVHP